MGQTMQRLEMMDEKRPRQYQYLTARTERPLYEALRAEAEREKRSITQQIAVILTERYEGEGDERSAQE